MNIDASKDFVPIIELLKNAFKDTTKIILVKSGYCDYEISTECCVLDNSDDIVEKVSELIHDDSEISYSEIKEQSSYFIEINDYCGSCESFVRFDIIPNNFNQWRNTITKLRRKYKNMG